MRLRWQGEKIELVVVDVMCTDHTTSTLSSDHDLHRTTPCRRESTATTNSPELKAMDCELLCGEECREADEDAWTGRG